MWELLITLSNPCMSCTQTPYLHSVYSLFQMQPCMFPYHVDAARVLVTAHALQRSHANGGALENHTTAGKAKYTFSMISIKMYEPFFIPLKR